MATTIIISTNVKPALRDVLFVFIYLVPICGVNAQQAGYVIITIFVHSLPVATTTGSRLAYSLPEFSKKCQMLYCHAWSTLETRNKKGPKRVAPGLYVKLALANDYGRT
jgi:hypothetical protein